MTSVCVQILLSEDQRRPTRLSAASTFRTMMNVSEPIPPFNAASLIPADPSDLRSAPWLLMKRTGGR